MTNKPVIIASVVIVVAIVAIVSVLFFFTDIFDPGTEPEDVEGDMNCDGVLDEDDVTYLQAYLTGDPEYSELCADPDVNNNGEVNIADAQYLASHIAGVEGFEDLYPE